MKILKKIEDKKIYFIIGGLLGYVIFKNVFMFLLLLSLVFFVIFDKVTNRKEVYYFDLTLVAFYIVIMLLLINTKVDGLKSIICAYGSLVLERRI